jgi:hypothetical protein
VEFITPACCISNAFYAATVYELWNMVLDPWGNSIDSKRPWPQNSPITVNPETREVRYTPMFGAIGSFAKFVRPGSRRVETEGTFTNALAFTGADYVKGLPPSPCQAGIWWTDRPHAASRRKVSNFVPYRGTTMDRSLRGESRYRPKS